MKEKLKHIFSLKEDQEQADIVKHRIEDSSKVTGTNMYILIFAIIIACIGLNINSTAVVIGAMLISPLMGVIISIAYGIAINDLNYIKRGLVKFLFQIVIAIVTSTIYFLLSPLNSFSNELIARTNPTFWDVLIALFGGFAAVIAHTRKSMISNVIPGAAIATALMPPLCTVGYCIASGRWLHSLGAFYLFSINAIFICIASIIGLYLMKFSSNKFILNNRKGRIISIIIIIIVIVPSIFLAKDIIKDAVVEENFNEYIKNEFNFENSYIFKADIDPKDKTIDIMLAGAALSQEEREKLDAALINYKLDDYNLKLTETGFSEVALNRRIDNMLKSDEEPDYKTKEEENKRIKNLLELATQTEKLKADAIKELMAIYPFISEASFADFYDNNENIKVVLIIISEETLSEETKINIKNWLKVKSNKDIDLISIMQ